MAVIPLLVSLFLFAVTLSVANDAILEKLKSHSQDPYTVKREILDVDGGPEDVFWVVQLSDLHFSVHHPERAREFREFVGPSLSMINPSLVLLTGDLTDSKSKDLLIMKEDEAEWMEYRNVMEDVIKRSGLKKNKFYDLRGNHDNFGVPGIGDSVDYFSKYSINSQLGRRGLVNSVTVETATRKILFVGFDSTMLVGLRGPTNLFGHPTDDLLAKIDIELSQWKSQSTKPVTKISYGHFPLSFSVASDSGKTLKHIFLKHSLSAYLCGHLHTKFGKNLKRHHCQLSDNVPFQTFFQLNGHQPPLGSNDNCSNSGASFREFWEWEMGDWRQSRIMRILAIDRGFISFVDIELKLGAKKTIILPTFPLDSRFVSTESSVNQYNCQSVDPSSYETVRALVFSTSPIVSVVARVYDSRSGNFIEVLEASMTKQAGTLSRGDLYMAPWNYKAFEDSSPDRYWLQIEAIDIRGRSTLTELRPFSINGLSTKLQWTWKEFLVMGCQWDALYYPILSLFYFFMFSLLVFPKFCFTFSKKLYHYKNFCANKGFINGIAWVLSELYGIPWVWLGMLVYLFYLLLFPWLSGRVFTDGGERGYMTYRGWVVKFDKTKGMEFLGFPDVMVVVFPHLFFIVLPTFLVSGALAAERAMYWEHFLSLCGKKDDDHEAENMGSPMHDYRKNARSNFCLGSRWIRKFLLLVSLAICWKHFKNARALMKAYEMNPLLHFPVYSLSMPLLLAYCIYRTWRVR